MIILIGCTDAEIGSLKAYGDSATIYCYSGGREIFRDQSTGKVAALEGGGWLFVSTNGKFIKTFADCFVEVEQK